MAPTSTPLSASATTLMTPSLPLLWIQPRLEDGTCAVPHATRIPASRACFSVMPTDPTSGSVNVTRLTAV